MLQLWAFLVCNKQIYVRFNYSILIVVVSKLIDER